MKLTVFKEILSWMTSATFTEIDVGKCTWLRRNHAAPLPQLLGPGTHKKKTSPKTYEALDLLGFFPIDSHDGFPVGKIYENISSPYTNSGSTLW